MSTTVSAFITAFASKYNHPYTSSDMVDFINGLEAEAWASILAKYAVAYHGRTAYVGEFALPSGVPFEDVARVFVDGREYYRFDNRADKELYSYRYDGGKLCIYPLPVVADVSYVSGANEITFATNTITTTGDDFSGISAGDVVVVSGCSDETDNNKTAVVASVSATVLTFPPSTFTAQAESATVTILVPKVKVIYKEQLAAKVVANIASETLIIPDRFKAVYDYFCSAKISYLQKEYTESNNHMAMFNARMTDFQEWHDSISPQEQTAAAQIRGGVAYEASSFDLDT